MKSSVDNQPDDDQDIKIREEKRIKKSKKKKKEKKEKKTSKRKVQDIDTMMKVSSKKKRKREKKLLYDQSHENEPLLNSLSSSEKASKLSIDGERRKPPDDCYNDDKMIQSSSLDFVSSPEDVDHSDTTLLLFYQYVEPPWDEETYKLTILPTMEKLGFELGGRMRVAREGLNCTLSGTHRAITNFCKALRHFHKGECLETEFKLTRDLPKNQHFPSLKVIPVTEIVHYGLEGEKAPPISYTGVHLEPHDYHQKLAENNTVVIDVRNHYEAAIGRFDPSDGAEYIDPKMRKSTEFPLWLDKKETKEKLKGKQVLMYCTGGVRCERASALLKFKMEHDPEIKELDIQGVYQLQGGIDKYFKEFPDGGFWSGKNYTFDKRFAHAPPKIDGELHSKKRDVDVTEMKGKCEACAQPWDMYRGKRRCPTCGVPSLICKHCFRKDQSGEKKLPKFIRCDLCVEENIQSKGQLKGRELKELQIYEESLKRKGLLTVNANDNKIAITAKTFNQDSTSGYTKPAPNPDQITKLFLKNMCRKTMDESKLLHQIPGITHIVWRTDRNNGQFLGQAWVEMATPEDAALAVGMNGTIVYGRPLYISYQPPDSKDRWPPPQSAVQL